MKILYRLTLITLIIFAIPVFLSALIIGIIEYVLFEKYYIATPLLNGYSDLIDKVLTKCKYGSAVQDNPDN